MSSFDDVKGHAAAREHLQRLLASGRLAHAYLFHGAEGIGKYRLAVRFAWARLCRRGGGGACGQCQDCRLARSGDHPDLLVLEASESGRLTIERVRQLIVTSRKKPVRAPGRVFLLRDAERLTEEAQNALLRTLEEPPPGCLVVLTSARPQGLAATVRSRCQELRLKRLSSAETVEVLEAAGCPAERLDLLALVAGGSPGQALALDARGFLELREPLLALIGGEAADPLGVVDEVMKKLKAGESGVRRQARLAVELWGTLVRDLVVLGAGGSTELIWHRDLARRLEGVARSRAPEALERALAEALEALNSLAVNALPELVLSDLALGAASLSPARGARR